MRYSKALFITPTYPERYFGGVRPPVGIAYLEEFVAAHGVQTDALDMNVTRGKRHLLRRISKFKPEIIGITLMTYQYSSTYSLICELKAVFPDIKIVVGGPHVSALEGGVITECDSVDYAIAGEGEFPMRDLCLDAPLENICGLYYRSGGAVLSGGPKKCIDNLDQLPFPRYSNYPLEKYTAEIEVSTSRGCPHKCIFCSVPNIMGRRIRYRSARLVGDELGYFWKQGIRAFQFVDDNFLASRRRVMALLSEIESRSLTGTVLRCGQGIRADLVNQEILTAMKRLGFKHLGIGVESGSDRVLKTICKHLTVEQCDRAVRLACDLGFDVTLLFVVGTPGETLEDVKKSVEMAKRHQVMKAHFFNLVPFPGTALFNWVSENGLLLGDYRAVFNRADEWKLRAKPFFATTEMPENDRIIAQKMTARASKEIQVRTLRRKFAGWGPIGVIAAQAGQFNFLERLFIRHRRFRRMLDQLIFRPSAANRG